jgi:DNA-binding transcriptional MerR regulator
VFTVGAFARLSGVSAKVLRAWDAGGLFRPAWVDRATGYRYYTPAQLPELRRILALRDVGMPLAEIAGLSSAGGDLRAALVRRREELEEARRELDRQLAALDIQVGAVGGPVGRKRGAHPADVVLRAIPSEPAATFDLSQRADRDEAEAYNELERYVRDHGARAHRPPGALADGRPTLWVPVRRAVPPTDRIGYRRLPACRAATLLHRGSYATLAEARAALLGWVDAAGLTAAAPLRFVYLQFGADADLRLPRAWVVERSADLVTELQLPVS